jgi:hypothetical protein
MIIERPINPPEESECKYCGEQTDNGSTCETCVEEQKADNK